MDLFAQIVRPEHVHTDAETLRRCSSDLFVWPHARTCRALVSRPGAVMIEPCIYWHDELSPVHLEQPDVVHAGKSGSAIHFPEGRELAIELRARLTDLFTEPGAVHLEPGEARPFRTLLAPQTAEALERLRQAFDPDDRLNPGNLER